MKINKKQTNLLFFCLLISLFFLMILLFPQKTKTETNNNICKFVVIGHFYSLQKHPDLQKLFVKELNTKYADADALIFLGDNTIRGSKKEMNTFFSILKKIKIKKLFAPGNHDLRTPDAYDNWMKYVGYTSKKEKIKHCNLLLLNTVNQDKLNFNDIEMIKGGGLDEKSIKLLTDLEKKKNETNLIFMHHSLHSIGLIHLIDTWYDELNRIYENEKIWREEIQPLIKNKVDGVFVGDLANRSISKIEIDNIPYIGNSMTIGFDPEPISDRKPLSYTTIEVINKKINVNIEYLPIPIDSDWFSFDRDHRYELFKDKYNPSYKTKK